MKDLLAYIAGPISKGDLTENIRQAHDAGLALLKAGIPVIVPHGSCFWGNMTLLAPIQTVGEHDEDTIDVIAFEPQVLPQGTTHADWYGMDLVIIRRCNAILRLPGESHGADLEVTEARKHGIPVFGSVAEVIAWSERLSGTANADGASGGGVMSDRSQGRWMEAIARYAWARREPLPHFERLEMGVLRSATVGDGRFATVKRRLVSPEQADIDGAEWCLWHESDGCTPVLLASIRKPILPGADDVAIVCEALIRWLVRGTSPEAVAAMWPSGGGIHA